MMNQIMTAILKDHGDVLEDLGRGHAPVRDELASAMKPRHTSMLMNLLLAMSAIDGSPTMMLID